MILTYWDTVQVQHEIVDMSLRYNYLPHQVSDPDLVYLNVGVNAPATNYEEFFSLVS